MPMSREQFTASAVPAAHFPAPASFPDDYPEHARFVREAEALRDEVLRAGHEPVAAFFTLCLNALRRDGLSGARMRQFEAAMKPVDELFFANFPEDPRFLRELAHAFCAGEGFPSRRLPTDIDDTLLNVLLEGLPLTAKTRFFDPFMEGGASYDTSTPEHPCGGSSGGMSTPIGSCFCKPNTFAKRARARRLPLRALPSAIS